MRKERQQSLSGKHIDRRINATVFYAYQICPREAWFYYHSLDSDKENPFLMLGKLIHEYTYKRERKEIFIDELLKIDLIYDELIAEVKKSSRSLSAAKLQLAYYLYYLKYEKGLEFKGVLLFPKERKRIDIELTPQLEKKVERILKEIENLGSQEIPPPAKRITRCKVCAFYEFCFAGEES